MAHLAEHDSGFEFFFQVFAEHRRKKFDFGHRSGVLDRPGSRELRAVKIPASYDAWRPPKRQKNDSEQKLFFSGFGNQFFVIFHGF